MRNGADPFGSQLDDPQPARADARPQGAHAAGPVCGPQLPFAVALRHGAHHEPLELPGHADAGPADRRAGRGQYRGGQTQRLRPCQRCGAAADPGRVFPARTGQRSHRRPGREPGPAAPEIRHDLFHRQQGRRQRGAALRRRAPDPRRAGTGRKKPLHRGKDRQDQAGGQAHRVRQVPELRPDLRGPRLYPVRRRHPRRTGGRHPAGDHSPVRGRPAAEPGLRQDHQRQALPAPDGADRPGQGGLRRHGGRGCPAHRPHGDAGRDLGGRRHGRGDLRPHPAGADLHRPGRSPGRDRSPAPPAGPLPVQRGQGRAAPGAGPLPLRRRLPERYHHPPCHQRHALWGRGRERHGRLPRPHRL